MTRDPGDPTPTPSPVIPDWRRLEQLHPKSSQIGVELRHLGTDWRRVDKDRVAQLPPAVVFLISVISAHGGEVLLFPANCQLLAASCFVVKDPNYSQP